MRGRVHLVQLSGYQLVKKDSAQWSKLCLFSLLITAVVVIVVIIIIIVVDLDL
jgi:hypothetical protein